MFKNNLVLKRAIFGYARFKRVAKKALPKERVRMCGYILPNFHSPPLSEWLTAHCSRFGGSSLARSAVENLSVVEEAMRAAEGDAAPTATDLRAESDATFSRRSMEVSFKRR